MHVYAFEVIFSFEVMVFLSLFALTESSVLMYSVDFSRLTDLKVYRSM